METLPLKPVKHSSPPTVVIEGREWTKRRSNNKQWSFYVSAGLGYHISVENATGQAHASPEGDGELVGHRLHVYAEGPVVNHVPFHLQGAADEWLSDETEMRETCAAFTAGWEAALEAMHTAYAAQKAQYDLHVVDLEGLNQFEQKEYHGKRRALKNTLVGLEKKCAVIETVGGSSGLWKVTIDSEAYLVPMSKFHPAKFQFKKGLDWTEEALLIAEEGFFLARRGTVVYICRKGSLRPGMKVSARQLRIAALPRAEYRDGLLRSQEGKLYRLRQDQIPTLVAESDRMKNFRDCVRVSIDGRVIAVKLPGKILVDVETVNSEVIRDLPVARREGALITVGESGQEQMYVWSGKWPNMPKVLDFPGGDWYKIMEPDGVHVFSVGDTEFFRLATDETKRTLWLDTLPVLETTKLKYGTYTFTLGGVDYLVARGKYDYFIADCMASKVRTGTSGCFVLKIPGSPRKAVDLAQIPAHLWATKEAWDGFLRKIPTATYEDGLLTIVRKDSTYTYKVVQIPVTDVPSESPTAVKVTIGDETLVIDTEWDGTVTNPTVGWSKKRKTWVSGLPTGTIDNGTVHVTINNTKYSYRMAPQTWKDIFSATHQVPTGSYSCFRVQSNGRMTGPISRRDPRLVEQRAWERWAKSIEQARRTLEGFEFYEIGQGPGKQYFVCDFTFYEEPSVTTDAGSCILIVVGNQPFPVARDSRSLFWLDLGSEDGRALIPQDVLAALGRRGELPEITASEAIDESDESVEGDNSAYLLEIAGYVFSNAENGPHDDTVELLTHLHVPQPTGRYIILTVPAPSGPAHYLFPADGADVEDQQSTHPGDYMIHQSSDDTWNLLVTTEHNTQVWLCGVQIDGTTGLVNTVAANEGIG
ncbi:hypothetical protein ACFYPT_36000 [Streptomyces sp. NPDC005529]|uniref:hypothetical protein n=1 Tax=unclassified Streptomyces TaxID=2593676 RepID=UPI0033B6D4CC